MRGSRVQAVVNELQGEKVDIIPWSPDAATFIVNALQPAEVVKVVLDEDFARIEVVVPDDQLSLAIGRRGQNVRLASQLTGWDIDILTEAEESERRQKEFVERTNIFMKALNVDEVVGQLLASEGFRSVEELAFVEPSEVAAIEGFDQDTAAEIQSRAHEYLAKLEAEQDARRRELGVSDDLKEVAGVTTAMLVQFGENDIKTVEDLAGCATDDLVGWSERKDGETTKHAGILDGFEISREEAETLIMTARVKAGWIEAIPDPAAEDALRRRNRRLKVFPQPKQNVEDHEHHQLMSFWPWRNRFGKIRSRRRGSGIRANLHRHPDERRAGGHDSLRHRTGCDCGARHRPQIAGTRRLGDGAGGSRRGSCQTASVFAGFQDKGRCFGKFGGRDRGSVDKGLSPGFVDGQQSGARHHGFCQS